MNHFAVPDGLEYIILLSASGLEPPLVTMPTVFGICNKLDKYPYFINLQQPSNAERVGKMVGVYGSIMEFIEGPVERHL